MRQAVEAYKAGQLTIAGGASGPAHAGMGRGMGRGMGMGRRAAGSPTPPAPEAIPASAREEEIAELKDMSGTLRKQLADVIERLDRLEKGS